MLIRATKVLAYLRWIFTLSRELIAFRRIVLSYDNLPESQRERNFNLVQILQPTGQFKTALGLVEILFTNLLHYEKKFTKLM